MYVENWSDWSDVSAGFAGNSWDKPATPTIPEPEEVIFAGYTDENYSGDAFVVYRNGDKFFTVEGSHCSCYGLEEQWEPEEYALEQLIAALEKRDCYGLMHAHRSQIISALKAKRCCTATNTALALTAITSFGRAIAPSSAAGPNTPTGSSPTPRSRTDMNAVTKLMTERDTREDDLKPLGKTILKHLRKRGSISPLEAMNTYGTMRLAAQIFDLREAGFGINSVEKTAEDGQKYTRYYFAA